MALKQTTSAMKKKSLIRLKKQLPFLKCLQCCKPNLRKLLLKHGDGELIKALTEICYNSIKGRIPIPPKSIEKLKPYKSPLRRLTDRSLSLASRRKILQTGGGPFITPIISYFLTSALGRLLQQG